MRLEAEVDPVAQSSAQPNSFQGDSTHRNTSLEHADLTDGLSKEEPAVGVESKMTAEPEASFQADISSPVKRRRSSLSSCCNTPKEKILLLSDDMVRENLGIVRAVLIEDMYPVPGGDEPRRMLLDSIPHALRLPKDQRSVEQANVVQ